MQKYISEFLTYTCIFNDNLRVYIASWAINRRILCDAFNLWRESSRSLLHLIRVVEITNYDIDISFFHQSDGDNIHKIYVTLSRVYLDNIVIFNH